MTQLTFDFSTSTNYSTSAAVHSPVQVASKTRKIVEPRPRRNASVSPRVVPVNAQPIRTGQSLSLYESGRKDLHHIGDLAQAVIDRYEIVHRRRAARIARERAAMQEQAALNCQ